jgi:hypothetical protein
MTRADTQTRAARRGNFCDELKTGDSMRPDGTNDGPNVAGSARPDGAGSRTSDRVAKSSAPPVLSPPRRPSRSSASAGIGPRLLDRDAAAAYLSVSVDTVDRLLQSGALHVVRLPVQRDRKTGLGVRGTTRRILIDRHELDSLVDQCREVVL